MRAASLCARDTPWKPSWKARSPAGEAAAEYKDRREKSIAERKAKAEDDDNLERLEGEGGGAGPNATRRAHTAQTVTSKLPQSPPSACNELDGACRAQDGRDKFR